jgi:hypothetical protein
MQLLPSRPNVPGRLLRLQSSGGQARRAARLAILLTARAAGRERIRCQGAAHCVRPLLNRSGWHLII